MGSDYCTCLFNFVQSGNIRPRSSLFVMLYNFSVLRFRFCHGTTFMYHCFGHRKGGFLFISQSPFLERETSPGAGEKTSGCSLGGLMRWIQARRRGGLLQDGVPGRCNWGEKRAGSSQGRMFVWIRARPVGRPPPICRRQSFQSGL